MIYFFVIKETDSCNYADDNMNRLEDATGSVEWFRNNGMQSNSKTATC